MRLVAFEGVSKRFEHRQVLRDVSLSLQSGERIGLVGRNGSGKTTALRMILERDAPDEGNVIVSPGVQTGYFSQFSELEDAASIREVLTGCLSDLVELEASLRRVEGEMATSDDPKATERLLRDYQELTEEMDRLDGWTYTNRIETVLSKLGFSETYADRPVGQLSGGWRNRAALAKILIEAPDLLLLDEPTNFLDLDGVGWLEQWLQKFAGGAIVVSHDRDFLENTVDRIVEIENYRFHEYAGGFTEYVRKKPIQSKSLNREFQYEEELLALENESIRYRQELRANPEKALRRKLANIKKRAEPPEVDQIVTGVYDALRVPNDLCDISHLSKAYDEQLLFTDLSFEIHKGDRVVIIGPNGSGKTTLLEALAEKFSPDSGSVKWLVGKPFAYYNRILDGLDPNDTVTHSVNVIGIAYDAARSRVNSFLKLLRLSEMDLRQKIGTLSGGQTARVALAHCLLSGSPVVILDEPTNHLDITSAQVMERALIHFPGAVIVVSHDRFFIDKVATRLLSFDGKGGVALIEGNWSTWQAGVGKRLAIAD